MPRHDEYWRLRSEGRCVNCHGHAGGYARCDTCRAKHHGGGTGRHYGTREPVPNPMYVEPRPNPTDIPYDYRVYGSASPRKRGFGQVNAKIGDARKLRAADAAWAKAKRKADHAGT